MMIIATDVSYANRSAKAAAVVFKSWGSTEMEACFVVKVESVGEYVPGQFYRRELPCIEKILELIKQPINCIIIDGYVTLGASETPGLGIKLWERLDRGVTVIGVAKTAFQNTPEECKLYRGNSKRPLFVTAAGTSIEDAKHCILSMSGNHRVPDMLKYVDQLSRGLV